MRNPPPPAIVWVVARRGSDSGCHCASATAPLCARRICGDRRRGLPITAGAAIITRNNMQRPLHLAEVRRPAADSPILPGPPPLALRRRRPGSVAEARIIFAAPICYANSPSSLRLGRPRAIRRGERNQEEWEDRARSALSCRTFDAPSVRCPPHSPNLRPGRNSYVRFVRYYHLVVRCAPTMAGRR